MTTADLKKNGFLAETHILANNIFQTTGDVNSTVAQAYELV